MRRLQLFVIWAPLLAALACHDGITSPRESSDNVPPSRNTTVSSTITPEVSAGEFHTCALKTDGMVVCWGDNNEGRTAVPAGVTSVSQLSAGDHTCAVKNDGAVVCWGPNSLGQTIVPSEVTLASQVSTSNTHTCALNTDGTVDCWGNNSSGQATVPGGLTSVSQVSAGALYTCALEADETVVCWGNNSDGQATVPGGLTSVLQISAGSGHSCALQTDGTVVCWGANNFGQVNVPSGLASVSQISVGTRHTCALKTDGTVICWGRNASGQATVPAGLTSVSQISAGANHTCALKTDGTVVCWGENSWGQGNVPSGLNLGVADVVDNTPPVIAAPAGVTAAATSATGAVLTFSASATDDSGVLPSFACSPASGSTFPIGDTPVTCTATDQAGNTATVRFVVTVFRAVEININPGSPPFSIRLSGLLPVISVIVRTTGSFDAALVTPATATLGDGAGTDASVAKHNGTPLATLVDVDRDGDKDLVLAFRKAGLVAAGDLTTATVTLVFRAALTDGSTARGEDVVAVIP